MSTPNQSHALTLCLAWAILGIAALALLGALAYALVHAPELQIFAVAVAVLGAVVWALHRAGVLTSDAQVRYHGARRRPDPPPCRDCGRYHAGHCSTLVSTPTPVRRPVDES